MNPRLRVEVGRQANFEYEIPPTDQDEAVWLGRGAFCKIRIADVQLSRRHCQFTFEEGQLYVEDLGSRNGTRLNGELIEGRVQLANGDHITVGNHELIVVYPAASRGSGPVLPELGAQEEAEEAYRKVAELSGQELAGYKLGEIVFNGEASVIFQAEDAEGGGTVAVKVLKPLSDVTIEDQNRFIRGAKYSAVLRHPNFVRVIRGGRSGGWYFVAMEFVQGRNLQDIVEHQGKPLALPVALKIAQQILAALQYAYENEVIFRAVRPDNVIIGKGAAVKLTDFDLVKPLAGRHESQVTRVMDGSLRVDPSFAAPELIAYPVVADTKADVFGAGATIYFMLCAQPPFGAMLPADKLTSAFDRVAEDPRHFNPDVPESICAVLRCSMAEYERYNSPGEMAEALSEAAAAAGL
ncbi:MAG: protein kinase domain-containing protein [Planctomycetota bacterium]|jgi:serine/threonine-protein kinase